MAISSGLALSMYLTEEVGMGEVVSLQGMTLAETFKGEMEDIDEIDSIDI